MTICIAAIAKEVEKEYIIFATDHMITTTMGQFEHSIVKYKQLNKHAVAMLAGHALLFDELVKLPKRELTYGEIKLQLHNNMKNKRNELIEKQILGIYDVDRMD